MKHYRVSIFNFDYTFGGHEALLDPKYVPAVKVISVRVQAHSRRRAAAKAYVRTVGRARVRKLLELNAPAICIQVESSSKVLASGLGKTSNWLGDCFVYDNLVETFYLRVEPLPAAQQADARQRTRCRRRRLFRALGLLSAN